MKNSFKLHELGISTQELKASKNTHNVYNIVARGVLLGNVPSTPYVVTPDRAVITWLDMEYTADLNSTEYNFLKNIIIPFSDVVQSVERVSSYLIIHLLYDYEDIRLPITDTMERNNLSFENLIDGELYFIEDLNL